MRAFAAAVALAAVFAAFCTLIPAAFAGTIGSTLASARMSVATTGAVGDLTLVLRPFSTEVPGSGTITISLDPAMTISSLTTCGVVHKDTGVAGLTSSRSVANRRLTWTLDPTAKITTDTSATTVIVCRNVGNPRSETNNLKIGISTAANGVELDSKSDISAYSVSVSPLGSVIRTVIPEDPRADVRSDALVITIFPLTNPLVAGDIVEVELPNGFLLSDSKATTCDVIQSSTVPSTTTISGMVLSIVLSGPVLAAERVVLRCYNIRNPRTPMPSSENIKITTMTAERALIDRTTTAMLAAITNDKDPKPKTTVIQSFVIYLTSPLTASQRSGIENIYCSETNYVCQSSQILWQFRSFDDSATTLTVGVFPRTDRTPAQVATAISAAQINIVARVRQMLDEHRIDVGTPVSAQIPGSCYNNIQDMDETDTDCGGVGCAQCTTGQKCKAHADCSSFNCVNLRCREPSKPNSAPAGASLAMGGAALVAVAAVLTLLGVA